MTGLYSLNKSTLFYNRNEVLNINNVSDALYQQHEMIVDAICSAKPLEAEKAAQRHIDYVLMLIETEFERRHRETISGKKYLSRAP